MYLEDHADNSNHHRPPISQRDWLKMINLKPLELFFQHYYRQKKACYALLYPGCGNYIKTVVLSIFLILLSSCTQDEIREETTSSDRPTPSLKNSSINAVTRIIDQNIITGTQITVQLKDLTGNKILLGGDIIKLYASAGELNPVIDHGNGVYSAFLLTTGEDTAITITGTINGINMDDDARVAIKISINTPVGALTSLGEKLFTDKSLSTPPGQSCASCHDIMGGTFIDQRTNNDTSEGANLGRFGGRNTPTIAYAAHTPNLGWDKNGDRLGGQFWDGRAKSLEEQARQPFLDLLEMANPDKIAVIEKLKNTPYADEFKTLFGLNSLDPENVDTAFINISQAISAFERSRIFSPFTSKWDDEMTDGKIDGDVFNDSEMRGFQAFKDGQCVDCHFTPDELLGAQVFTNFKYENIGVPRNQTNPLLTIDPEFRDFGAGSAPDNPLDGPHFVQPPVRAEKGKFKIPSLRNVAVTPPYMHNGVFKTLEQVVAFYNGEQVAGVSLSAEVGDTIKDGGRYVKPRLFNAPGEKEDLIAFLKTLTDSVAIK